MYAHYLLQAGLVAYLIALEGDKHPHEVLARIKPETVTVAVVRIQYNHSVPFLAFT